ncbi:MAG: AraC family transcriptional regulator [Clostridia bacterium]|nr:AraC family transcriptional regulator [Clostridia bacterium]
MIFESKYSVFDDNFSLDEFEYLAFPLHIHRSFEFIGQIEGVTEVIIDGKKYILSDGDAVLIFPFQTHSFAPKEKGRLTRCIFATNLVSEFDRKNGGKLPLNNKFKCIIHGNAPTDSIYHKKALAYYICGEFDLYAEYVSGNKELDGDCLLKLLTYADKNYKTPCVLRDAATEIGYDYAYLSKFFKRRVGIAFRKYVNLLRLGESRRLLSTSDKTISQIGEESGFRSLRAFDREFFAEYGISPAEYRKKGLK